MVSATKASVMRIGDGALGTALAVATACGHSSLTADAWLNPCTPGASVACTAPGGCMGGQVCNASGTFEPCVCGMDAGTDAGPADPYFSSVVLLMHLDGPDGGTAFTDIIGNSFSIFAGSPALSTTK